MVLVEVVQLVVHVDGSFDFLVNGDELDLTFFLVVDEAVALLVVSLLEFRDSVTHYLQDDSDCEEHYTEDTEC